MDDRAIANALFYFGPVWEEHKATMKGLLTDTDNVRLLRPLTPERGVTVLQMVDPVAEPGGAQGLVVLQIFALKPTTADSFVRPAEPTFAAYRAAGVREAAVLVTLDAPNNFPQLTFRTDGPFLVWIGVLKDAETLERTFNPMAEQAVQTFAGMDLLRGNPETVILQPTRRSRLRWLSDRQAQQSAANQRQRK